jgi:hypothetical protein
METVDLDALAALATSLAAEAKGQERAARRIKQQSAALRDHIIELQSKEDKSDRIISRN